VKQYRRAGTQENNFAIQHGSHINCSNSRFWCSFLSENESIPRAIAWLEELRQLHNPMTSSGIEPATFWLLEKCFNYDTVCPCNYHNTNQSFIIHTISARLIEIFVAFISHPKQQLCHVRFLPDIRQETVCISTYTHIHRYDCGK
jgi:hypothetical protein